jgi:hypothetical protein
MTYHYGRQGCPGTKLNAPPRVIADVLQNVHGQAMGSWPNMDTHHFLWIQSI